MKLREREKKRNSLASPIYTAIGEANGLGVDPRVMHVGLVEDAAPTWREDRRRSREGQRFGGVPARQTWGAAASAGPT
jgi:hypothetical protein